jgi:hypothetical protein
MSHGAGSAVLLASNIGRCAAHHGQSGRATVTVSSSSGGSTISGHSTQQRTTTGRLPLPNALVPLSHAECCNNSGNESVSGFRVNCYDRQSHAEFGSYIRALAHPSRSQAIGPCSINNLEQSNITPPCRQVQQCNLHIHLHDVQRPC